jgi:hypothetical protein
MLVETGLSASLIMCLLCPAMTRGSEPLKLKYPMRLRGGSCAIEDASDATHLRGLVSHCNVLPNPRLYHPTPQKVVTKIQYAPGSSEDKEDIKLCQVIGSWSNWSDHEPLIKNYESGVWEIVKLLLPGEYKVFILRRFLQELLFVEMIRSSSVM